MAVGGLFALFDDIALLMKKAAGVTGDDFAVSAGQCHGLPAHREIPVLWRITKGSLLNKAILVVLLLLIEWFAPVLATVMLVVGGCYIAFEAGEKLAAWLGMHDDEHDEVLVDKTEDELVKGALRTDMVLSAEIMIISLAAAGQVSFEYKALLLTVVGFLVTFIIYGIVTLLVRLDDMGVALMRSSTSWVKRLGIEMTYAAPKIMHALGVIGTWAIFMVVGGIFRHVFHDLNHNIPFIMMIPEILGDVVVGLGVGMLLVCLHKALVKKS